MTKYDGGVRLEEYSEEDFARFTGEMKKYYVHRIFDWYDTDMSDSDSGTIHDRDTVNYTNLVIKDGAPYAVLVRTRAMFPDYFLLNIEKRHRAAALGGGYSRLDYDWQLKEKEYPTDTPDHTGDYLVVHEEYSTKDGEVNRYTRCIKGIMPDNQITAEGELVGFEYYYEDEKTITLEKPFVKLEREDSGYTVTNVVALVKNTHELAARGIFPVTYPDFSAGRYEILADSLAELT